MSGSPGTAAESRAQMFLPSVATSTRAQVSGLTLVDATASVQDGRHTVDARLRNDSSRTAFGPGAALTYYDAAGSVLNSIPQRAVFETLPPGRTMAVRIDGLAPGGWARYEVVGTRLADGPPGVACRFLEPHEAELETVVGREAWIVYVTTRLTNRSPGTFGRVVVGYSLLDPATGAVVGSAGGDPGSSLNAGDTTESQFSAWAPIPPDRPLVVADGVEACDG